MSSACPAFKDAVAGLSRRKLIVAGYVSGTQPLVEVRFHQQGGRMGPHVDLTLPQARQMLRLLLTAIESADSQARHDGTEANCAGDRESSGEAPSDVGPTV
ncbi:hypothetical protein ASF53_19565 [Methylobacterium sp. Leaf123]|uniref:hypothetical protein n=1 Tax=Methylobacterium sp. Leaf123 TaxID=1736264 RepID=UPI0006F5C22C|nr:hypothetical protein [Methylobacterium sp. Leaf123]KQQ29432.1 hypothetical protein ASF53_19565 [Methylobacterium sp. Leaf123]